MKTQIPAKTIVTCDICKCTCTYDNYKLCAKIKITGVRLDWIGQPAADLNVEYDLCDSCYDKIAKYINKIEGESCKPATLKKT